ncbi:MAG TPA: CocE/NonD family hydrolase [Gemmatimonadales bacterium]|nr:CocE/NonD family hydrolase [Gemmatimonadales bacterium]
MRRILEALLYACAAVVVGTGCAPSRAAGAGIRVDSAIAVPMRDGVRLTATIWRPAAPERVPVLIVRTPYGRGEEATGPDFIDQAVARGYAVVVQDVRGRYDSEGEFEPYRHEGRDGYDTIEWAARQPWSSGAVGTFGLSYPGAVQWLAAVERPPALRAMVPAMTYATPESFWYSGGVWDGSWLDWTWWNIAPDLRRRLGAPGPRTDAEVAAAWKREGAAARRHRPLLTLPHFDGIAPWYYEWMRHPPGDPWWDWATPEGRYDGVGAAVLNISGWFDEPYGPVGAVANYTGLVRTREPGKARTALILGPWTHGVDAVGRTRAGDRAFGPDAAIDYTATVLRWMDRHLKGAGPTSSDSLDGSGGPTVRVFVMGSNQWRTANTWPVPGTSADTLYLGGSSLTVSDSAAAGDLARRPPARDGESVIRSDPSDPLRDPYDGEYGAHDYRALAGNPAAVVFETQPFAEPYELIGQVVAELEVSATVPDFDLWLHLHDVAPDGTAWNLASAGTALLRASYREGGPTRHLVPEGKVVPLRLEGPITANRFLPGHRLRVVLTGAFYPFFSVNPQTGEQEFESDETRAGNIRIHHSDRFVSRLILPKVPVASE